MTEQGDKPDQLVLSQSCTFRTVQGYSRGESLLDSGITMQRNKPEETTVLLFSSLQGSQNPITFYKLFFLIQGHTTHSRHSMTKRAPKL